MENMMPLMAAAPFLALTHGLPAALTILNLMNLFAKNPRHPGRTAVFVYTVIPVLTLILYSMWSPPPWEDALRLGGFDFAFHEPFSRVWLPMMFIVYLLALAGFLLLYNRHASLPPLAGVLCMAAVYLGCAFSILWIVQISGNFSGAYLLMPTEPYLMCLFPLNTLVSAAFLTRKIVRESPPAPSPPTGPIPAYRRILERSRNWPALAFLFLGGFIGVVLLVCLLCGQRPDALIGVFTNTSDWSLSQRISPPTTYYDAHYLCTVAAGGHEKLVRPQRMGVRHSRKIIVNRQLCVANAFEELISEKAPRFHRFVRGVYDRCGYPISKHIKTKRAADTVYLLMKPLEWLFLCVLYLCDRSPENRIAWQYLPPETQRAIRTKLPR